MKKKLAMLLAATMLATLFTGCGAGGKEDKGELNLYTWDGGSEEPGTACSPRRF